MKTNKKIIILFLILMLILPDRGIFAAGEKTLTLEECIALAAKNSFEVRLARLDFLIAETDQENAESIYDTIFSAQVSYEKDKREPLSVLAADQSQTNIYSIEATKKLPTGTELTLSLDDTREWSNSTDVTRNPAHTAEATIEARQDLGKNIFGYIDRREVSITGLAIQNAGLDTQERIEALLADVEKAYWDWVFAKKNLEVYRQLLEKAQDLHRRNAQNYDIGRIERGDFLASQANVLLREKDLLIAENTYKHAQENIKLLMNIETAQRIHPAQTLGYREMQIGLRDCLDLAFKKRRDYQKAKREVEIKNLTLQTKANERWPEIDLVASLAANGIDSEFGRAINNITTDDKVDYYAALEVSISLENRSANSQFKKAEHNKEKALLNLKKTERIVLAEVGDRFRNFITYKANAAKIIEAAKLQREKLSEEEKRFKYGRSNTKTLIDYQQDHLFAQLEVAKGLVELEVAKVNLEKALNIILEKYKEWL